jgi:hypothetical protein
MFQLKKREPLSLLPAPMAVLEEGFDVGTGVLDESFQGWLLGTTWREWESGSTNTQARRIRPITTREFLQVERATVRESYEHSVWPKDAFARFVAADVIRSRR